MQIIDSHVHIWVHHPKYPWSAEEQDVPSFDALPDALLQLIRKNGVGRAVLVQYIKYRWDNRYVAGILKDSPSLFMGVCRVNPEDPNSADHLSYWTEEHGFRGVRISPLPDARGDWFTGPLMPPLFKRAAALNVPVIVLIKPERLHELARIVEQVPEVNVIIDHLADCIGKYEIHLDKLVNLARYPQIFLKLGHIAENSTESFPWCDTHRSLEKIFQNFGARRVMWGSDWPFTLKHMTYEQSLAYVLSGLTCITQEEREWVTSKTALQFWPFPEEISSGS